MTIVGTNVTPPGNSFVGREDVLAELKRAFEGGARLVTLVGAPGTGKTRVALHYALACAPGLAPPMSGGAWFVDLSAARTFEHAASVVARVVGISLTRDESAGVLSAQLAQVLSMHGPMLLVLDNFEQLAAQHALDLARLVEGAPYVDLLVTSRERLCVGAEHVVELEPLALPGEARPLGAAAAQLFVDRARAVRSGYSPASDPDEAARVAEIVRLLDGLPLPIELAAARMGVLGSAKLLERLRDRRLDVLSRAARDVAPRHASLRTALEWSWELLPADAQRALEICSVFAGDFDLDAAEAVLDDEGALDALHRLRDASLLRLTDEAEPRFSMFASIRELGRERLDAAGGRAAALARHGRYFAALADDALGRWTRYGDPAARRELERAADELREVLARGDADTASPCALALDVVLAVHGPLESHRRVLSTARSLSSGADLGRILAASAALELRSGHARRALELATRAHALAPDPLVSLELARASIACGEIDAAPLDTAPLDTAPLDTAPLDTAHGRDRWSHLWVEIALAIREVETDRAAEAAERARPLVAEADELGDRRASAEAREVLARALVGLGRHAEAAPLVEGALDERRTIGEPFAFVRAIALSARLASERGQDALPAHRAALNLARAHGFVWCEVEVLVSLALDRLDSGDVVRARGAADDAVRAARSIDVPSALGPALLLSGLARLAGPDAEGAREPFAEAVALGAPPQVAALAKAGLAVATDDPGGEPPGETAAALLLAMVDPSRASAALRAARTLEANVQLVRVLARMLREALPQRERRSTQAEALDPDGVALVVGPGGCWFRPPGGELVELDRKNKPAALLSALSLARLDSEAPLGHARLVGEVWPDEKILPSAAKDRLYATVALLRKAGLGDHVQSEPAGYRLDPSLRVIRVD